MLAATARLAAQSVFSTPEFTLPQNDYQAQQNPIVSSQDNEAVPQFPPSPLQLGPLLIDPHALYRYSYSKGIQAGPGRPLNTDIQEFAPGVLVSLGSHWFLDYTPTWTFYSNAGFRNTVDESVALNGGTTYQDWILGVSQSFVSSTPSLIETGAQTKQKTYATHVSADYHLGGNLDLNSIFNQNIQVVEHYPSSYDWSDTEQLRYQFPAGFNAGAGFLVGYTVVQPGVDMSYVEPQAVASWKVTDKIVVSADGGIENRQFHVSGAGSRNYIVFSANVDYQPVKTTEITLGANRGVAPSLFVDQEIETVQWNLTLRQRLIRRFYLNVGYTFANIDYTSSGGMAVADRKDANNAWNLSLSTVLLRRFSVDVFYQNSHNSSNAVGYSFSSSEVGADVSVRF